MNITENKVQNIYLVRHGKPQLPYQRMYYGNADYPLSPEGEASAEALGRALAGMRFDHVYTSALVRARQTLLLARPDLCTDNAAMIAFAGLQRFLAGQTSALEADVDPNLPLVG